MTYGFTGKVLRINLTERTVRVETEDEKFYKKYLGGRNISAYYLLKEIPIDADPLGPENILVATTSPLTGTPIPGSARHTLGAKSPLTGGFGDSEAGGFWGPELKFAGYDTVIVEGKADKPCYIMIKDDDVQIVDAGHLWGKDTNVVQEMIREEHEDQKIRVLQTGIAGERLVKYAAVTNELKHWNGRTGLGAVMGSKNLRAIAVRGTKEVPLFDKAGVLELSKWFAQNRKNNDGLMYLSEFGTSAGVGALNGMGLLPTENFRKGNFDRGDEMTGEKMHDEILVKREGCYACPVRCKRVVEVTKGSIKVDKKYGGPEYESMGALGSACAVSDLTIIAKANELCGRYGMDTISTGVTIAWAMECFDLGLIDKEITGGLEVTFGNGQVMLELIRQIAHREGFGAILAEGSYRAGEIIGKGTVKYSMTTRRQEFAAHEPRGKWNIGLGYAVSATGADHLVVAHDHAFENEPDLSDALGGMDLKPLHEFGIRDTIEATSLNPEKIRMFVTLQHLWSLYNVVDVCVFVGVPERRMFSLQQLQQMINRVTGWDMGFSEMISLGEKGSQMARMFNVKHDCGCQWDILPERMFEPLQNGAYEGVAIDKAEFEAGLHMYYDMMGWDEKGQLTTGKLAEFQLLDLV